MSTKHPDLFAALAEPFVHPAVKVRTLSGRRLAYITARSVMNRLDTVLGPENWWDDFEPRENSVLCKLTIRLPDGSTLTKSDAGGYAGMADSGDDDKSGYSDAFKRAAVKFGIARELYGDGVADLRPAQAPGSLGWVHGDAPGATPPTPPTPHRPATPHTPAPARTNGVGPTRVNGRTPAGPPATGKQLFAWSKDREQEYEVALIKYLNSWGRLQDFPGRMVDWDAEQVALAHAEAVRKLDASVGGAQARGEALAN